jgi:tetratricopeptide (TPR) repeat protein
MATNPRLLWLLMLLLIPALAGAYDYLVNETFHSYSANLFTNAWELGQGTATVASGQGALGAMSNPASLGQSELLETGLGGGTMLNYRGGGTAYAAWHGILGGYGVMRATVPKTRILTDRLEAYIQSNYANAANVAFLGYGMNPWDWLSLGIKGNYATNMYRVGAARNPPSNDISDTLEYRVNSITGDGGLQLHFEWFSAGFAYRNFGTKSNRSRDNWDETGTIATRQTVTVIPEPMFSYGLALTSVRNLIASIQVDNSGYKDGIPWMYKAGVELRINPWFSGRFGYDSEFGNESGGGVCLGTGMKLGNYLLDVALVDGTRLNTSQRYSLSALVNVSYMIPSPAKSQRKAVYSRKYYDEETLKLIEILKEKSRDYEANGDYRNALETIDTLLAWNPDDRELQAKYEELSGRLKKEEAAEHLSKANIYFNDGDYTDAVLEGQAALLLSPNDVAIAEFVKQAQAMLEEAQKARNQEIAKLLNDADTAYTSGQFATATTRYQAVLAIDTTNLEAQQGVERATAKINEQITLGIAKAQQAESANKYDEAIAEYQAVLAIYPGSNDAKVGIAGCRKIKEEKVRNILDTAITYYNSGDYDAAESRFKAVLALDKGNKSAQTYLARLNPSDENKTGNGNSRGSTNYAGIYQLGVNAYTARDYSTAIAYWSQIPEGNSYYHNAQINIARAQAILREFNN